MTLLLEADRAIVMAVVTEEPTWLQRCRDLRVQLDRELAPFVDAMADMILRKMRSDV